MPKKQSTAHKLDRVRPPRVQITYDVEVGDAIEKRELPFVVGVLGDFSGKADPDKPQKRLKDRSFVEASTDNFDSVMEGMAPRAAFKVDNKLTDDDSKLSVDLRFKSMDDFEPEQVVRQVEPLRRLLEVREQLTALLAKTDGNDKLTEELQKIISNTETLQQLAKDAGVGEAGGDKGEGEK